MADVSINQILEQMKTQVHTKTPTRKTKQRISVLKKKVVVRKSRQDSETETSAQTKVKPKREELEDTVAKYLGVAAVQEMRNTPKTIKKTFKSQRGDFDFQNELSATMLSNQL